jgi:hypothetical protein
MDTGPPSCQWVSSRAAHIALLCRIDAAGWNLFGNRWYLLHALTVILATLNEARLSYLLVSMFAYGCYGNSYICVSLVNPTFDEYAEIRSLITLIVFKATKPEDFSSAPCD